MMKNEKTVEPPERELQCSFALGKNGKITLPKKIMEELITNNGTNDYVVGMHRWGETLRITNKDVFFENEVITDYLIWEFHSAKNYTINIAKFIKLIPFPLQYDTYDRMILRKEHAIEIYLA
jgi:hypothetical protein